MIIYSLLRTIMLLPLLALVLLPFYAEAQAASAATHTFPEKTTTAANPYEFSFRLDCNKITPERLKPNELWVRFTDMTEDRANDKQRFARLGKPACNAAAGALRLSGAHASRIKMMEFVLMDAPISQALFKATDKDGKPRRHVAVTTALVDPALPPSELLFAIAHELGHALYNHPAENEKFEQSERLKGLAVGVGGVLTAGLIHKKKSLTRNIVAGAVGIGSAAYMFQKLCDSTVMSEKNEMIADAFGIKVMQQLGYTKDQAKADVIAVMVRHDPDEKIGSGWCGEQNSHPSTKERKDAILAL
jgi:Zn-dependent protease with chaperone function